MDRQHRVYLYAEIAFYVAGGLVVVGLISKLADVLWPLFVACAVAYLLDPFVDRLEARGLSRERSILVLVVAFLLVATASAIALVPVVAHEVARFSAKVPR